MNFLVNMLREKEEINMFSEKAIQIIVEKAKKYDKLLIMSKMNKEITCSFCGKSQSCVKQMIVGQGVNIYNECVDICNEIIEESKKENKSE